MALVWPLITVISCRLKVLNAEVCDATGDDKNYQSW